MVTGFDRSGCGLRRLRFRFLSVSSSTSSGRRAISLAIRLASSAVSFCSDTLIRYCRERLASQKVPAIIEFRDEIPKSATGNILRGKLMENA